MVLKSSLLDFSDAYILVKGAIKINPVESIKQVRLKNCASFTACICEMNNIQVDNGCCDAGTWML